MCWLCPSNREAEQHGVQRHKSHIACGVSDLPAIAMQCNPRKIACVPTMPHVHRRMMRDAAKLGALIVRQPCVGAYGDHEHSQACNDKGNQKVSLHSLPTGCGQATQQPKISPSISWKDAAAKGGSQTAQGDSERQREIYLRRRMMFSNTVNRRLNKIMVVSGKKQEMFPR